MPLQIPNRYPETIGKLDLSTTAQLQMLYTDNAYMLNTSSLRVIFEQGLHEVDAFHFYLLFLEKDGHIRFLNG